MFDNIGGPPAGACRENYEQLNRTVAAQAKEIEEAEERIKKLKKGAKEI